MMYGSFIMKDYYSKFRFKVIINYYVKIFIKLYVFKCNFL